MSQATRTSVERKRHFPSGEIFYVARVYDHSGAELATGVGATIGEALEWARKRAPER